MIQIALLPLNFAHVPGGNTQPGHCKYEINSVDDYRPLRASEFIIYSIADAFILNQIVRKFGIRPTIIPKCDIGSVIEPGFIVRFCDAKQYPEVLSKASKIEYNIVLDYNNEIDLPALEHISRLNPDILAKLHSIVIRVNKASQLMYLPNGEIHVGTDFEVDIEPETKLGFVVLDGPNDDILEFEIETLQIFGQDVRLIKPNSKITNLIIITSNISPIHCQNVANNENIKSIRCGFPLVADFSENYTLTQYVGSDILVAEIASRNLQEQDKIRFVKTRAIYAD